MNLRAYLKTLKPYEQHAFAARAGTTLSYLRKTICLGTNFGPATCTRIEQASGGAVTRKELRADWARIWPELD